MTQPHVRGHSGGPYINVLRLALERGGDARPQHAARRVRLVHAAAAEVHERPPRPGRERVLPQRAERLGQRLAAEVHRVRDERRDEALRWRFAALTHNPPLRDATPLRFKPGHEAFVLFEKEGSASAQGV